MGASKVKLQRLIARLQPVTLRGALGMAAALVLFTVLGAPAFAQEPAAPQLVPQPAPQTPAPATAPQAAAPPAPAPPAPAPVRIGNLSLQNASLTEVIDQLARQLKINYILDPAVKGSIVLNTYGDTTNLDARNLLDLILRINDAGMVQEGEIYRIVPLKQVPRLPIKPEVNPRNIPEDDQPMLNLVFLKYVTVDELSKVLGEFVGENAKMYSYAPGNLLFVLDSRRNMRRTMDLIALFDSDTFANQRVRLFDVKNTRPSDLLKDLDAVLKAVSLDGKNTAVRFLPVDRINTLIAVAPNPGVFDTVEQWLKKLDVPVQVTAGGSNENYVYRVRYGRAECLAMALNQLFGYMPNSGYGGGYGGGFPAMGAYSYPAGGGMGGMYGGNFGGGFGGNFGGGGAYPTGNGGGNNSYGNQNTFNNSFGGSGGCNGMTSMGMGGGGMGGGYGGGGYGYPVFGGYSAQAPANAMGQVPGAVGAQGTAGAQGSGAPPQPLARIVANPFDNALIIQADAQQLQNILKILKDLDVAPRQILLEAKIYSVALTGSFSSGVSAQFQKANGSGNHSILGNLTSTGASSLTTGFLVGQSRELLMFLSLSENTGRTRVLSEPSLIATDSIPASITVGTQVPVQTATSAVNAGTSTVSSTISSHNTGVTMQVNARVNPSGVVTLIINQEVSKPGSGSGTLTPSFDQQVVQTQITVQDGDTIAIGGIISEDTSSATAGIPGLIHIPVLGALFGTKTYNKNRSELIIFMTPHVILDESDLVDASNELKDRVKKLRRYVKEL
ncbi:MAG: type II secretion system secretin GspD [Bryobacteraceae bacterium]